jgi:glycosyltransferase involved in cell wall biosynthesis
MSLDEYAVANWRRSHPEQAQWWPEPPASRSTGAARKEGHLVVFGSLAPRKGITELLDALLLTERARSLTLAGRIDPGFRSEIENAVARVRDRDLDVQILDDWISDEVATDLLATASLAVIGYSRHYGMSRVMLEAAAVGTPIVGSNFGLIGKQIRDHGLGVQVDVADAAAFASAIDEVLERGPDHYSSGLDVFASQYSDDARHKAIEFILQQ